MKTNPTSLLRVVVVLAMLGTYAIAQDPEAKSSSSVTIEVNGKKVTADGSGGTIIIRTDGDEIEIDTDGDGTAEERVEKNSSNEKVAWLGVKTNDVSPELAAQLELEGGAVVEMIVPDSPAELGGIAEHDIITSIGDTQISTASQLAEAIRALKPASETSVTVLRKSKPIQLTVTLGERPAMPQNRDFDIQELAMNGQADAIRQRIEKIQKEMMNGLNFKMETFDLPNVGNGDIIRMSSKSTSFSDGNGSITIKTKDGVTQIEAKDADGNLLYEGPAETDEDRQKLPPEVLEKLERFEAMDVDIDIKGFENKLLPPIQDAPQLKPAKPKKSTL